MVRQLGVSFCRSSKCFIGALFYLLPNYHEKHDVRRFKKTIGRDRLLPPPKKKLVTSGENWIFQNDPEAKRGSL
jgi:hypothetical protein